MNCPQRTQRIETVLSQGNNRILADIDKQLKELQAELLKLATSNADYEKAGNEINRLRDEKQKLMIESVNRDELKNRIADMGIFLRNSRPPSRNTTSRLSGGWLKKLPFTRINSPWNSSPMLQWMQRNN